MSQSNSHQQLPINAALDTLAAMFESVDRDVIHIILIEQCAGNMEKAVEALLRMTDDASQTTPQSQQVKKTKHVSISHPKHDVNSFTHTTTRTTRANNPYPLQHFGIYRPTSALSPVQQLINKGFEPMIAAITLQKCNNSIDAAISLLSKPSFSSNISNVMRGELQHKMQHIMFCKGNITTCIYLIRLNVSMQIAEVYDQYMIEDGASNIDVLTILDDFQHLKVYHESDDDFKHIYDTLGGECAAVCDKCAVANRHRTDQRVNEAWKENKPTNNPTFHMKELFDEIHCYFRHGYDCGLRLNEIERAQIESLQINNEDDDKYDEHETRINSKSKAYREILKGKKMTRDKYTKYRQTNKFAWNLGQSKTLKTYSCSFEWHYNKKFSNPGGARFDMNAKQSDKDLYVPQKYSSLREELLQNEVHHITVEQFKHEMNRAEMYKNSKMGKKCRAHFLSWRPDHALHPANSGYVNNDAITKEHLFVVRVYCSLDHFQFAFSKTYRSKCANDDFYAIRKRHSNFHHFAKRLKEAVQCFGTYYHTLPTNRRIYHGIDQEMYLNRFHVYIFCPLSTTCSWSVAMNFSGSGMILELAATSNCKFFRCDWISKFAHEKELLFIGGWGRMCIVNITNIVTDAEFYDYLTALRAIDSMINANYFHCDPTDVLGVIKDVDHKAEVVPLKQHIIRLCLQLIYHELKRNKFELRKYPDLPSLDPYAARMAHEMFASTDKVTINWTQMNTNTVIGDNEDDVLSGYMWGCAYGYLFLKLLFCPFYEGVRFDVLKALLPNLYDIHIEDLSHIDSRFLDDILRTLKYWHNKAGVIAKVKLLINPRFRESNVDKIFCEYESQFKNIGYTVDIEDSFESAHCPKVKGVQIWNRVEWSKTTDRTLVNSSQATAQNVVILDTDYGGMVFSHWVRGSDGLYTATNHNLW